MSTVTGSPESSNTRAVTASGGEHPGNDAQAGAFVGNSSAVQFLFDRVERFAGSDAPVLITGESGTGKELVAHALHRRSHRAAGPFVAVSCAAFPETLLEAELFGHERGAFTGAVRRREGRFKAADRGTLFLDEIGDMPLTAQVKLLRVLQEGVFEPLGTNHSVSVDVRIVSATHRDLRLLAEQGRFREDLFFRLNILEVQIPPLRARREDIALLIDHFVALYGSGRPARVSDAARLALDTHPYPGNVRELEHIVRQALVLAGDDPIDVQHLPTEVTGLTSVAIPLREADPLPPLAQALFDFEGAYLRRALDQVGGVKHLAAEILGISRKNLWQKLRRHGFVPREPRSHDVTEE